MLIVGKLLSMASFLALPETGKSNINKYSADVLGMRFTWRYPFLLRREVMKHCVFCRNSLNSNIWLKSSIPTGQTLFENCGAPFRKKVGGDRKVNVKRFVLKKKKDVNPKK